MMANLGWICLHEHPIHGLRKTKSEPEVVGDGRLLKDAYALLFDVETERWPI